MTADFAFMPLKTDYADASFKCDGHLKLLIVVGARPEVIRLSEIIKKCRRHFGCLLVHAGRDWDYALGGIFFRDLALDGLDVYVDAAGKGLGKTVGNIIDACCRLMAWVRPVALPVLGGASLRLSTTLAKRPHVPIFHMEADRRCEDERPPKEANRRIVVIQSYTGIVDRMVWRKYRGRFFSPSQVRAFGRGVALRRGPYVIQALRVPTHGVATYVE